MEIDHQQELFMFGLVFVLLIFVGIGAKILYDESHKPVPTPIITAAPAIRSMEVSKPFIAVYGTNLASVEVWAIPTGTGVSQNQYIFLGKASAKAGTKNQAVQTWLVGIPSAPLSITSIFANGYDEAGHFVGKITLPTQGATNLYTSIWGGSTPTQTGQQTVTLSAGQQSKVGNLSLTFKGVLVQGACPKNVQCIWQGQPVAETLLSDGTTKDTIEMVPKKQYTFGAYTITVTELNQNSVTATYTISQ